MAIITVQFCYFCNPFNEFPCPGKHYSCGTQLREQDSVPLHGWPERNNEIDRQ